MCRGNPTSFILGQAKVAQLRDKSFTFSSVQLFAHKQDRSAFLLKPSARLMPRPRHLQLRHVLFIYLIFTSAWEVFPKENVKPLASGSLFSVSSLWWFLACERPSINIPSSGLDLPFITSVLSPRGTTFKVGQGKIRKYFDLRKSNGPGRAWLTDL